MKDSRAIIQKTIIIASVILTILFVLPTIISSWYSVMIADDFSAGRMFKQGYTGWKYIKYYYDNWQGTYSGLAFIAWLSPILHGGLAGLKFIMVANSIMLFASFAFLFDSIVSKLFGQSSAVLRVVVVMISVYTFTAFNSYFEGIYWFTGAAVYTIPSILTMLGLGITIRKIDSLKVWHVILISVLGFIGMGGSLIISGFGCYFLLLIVLNNWYRTKKLNISNVIIFMAWFIGALINVLAPGNYVRHEVADSTGIHPIGAIATSIKVYIDRIEWFNQNTSICAILVLLVLCGFVLSEKINTSIKDKLIVLVATLILPIVSLFPVALGQGSNMPNRVLFVLDVSIIVVYVVFALLLADFIKGYIDAEGAKKILIVFFVTIILVSMSLDGFEFSNNVIYKVSSNICRGVYQEYNRSVSDILEKLDSYEEGADVVLSAQEMPEDIDNFKNFYVDIDPADWVNIDMSMYYGFNSIRVE